MIRGPAPVPPEKEQEDKQKISIFKNWIRKVTNHELFIELHLCTSLILEQLKKSSLSLRNGQVKKNENLWS